MEDKFFPEIEDKNWEYFVEKSDKPVFVMFHSPMCRHCTQIIPVILALAEQYHDIISFCKINILQFGWIGERYGVMATPTFIFFCGGKPIQTRVGAVFPPVLKKMIEEMIVNAEECRLRSTEIKYEISSYG